MRNLYLTGMVCLVVLLTSATGSAQTSKTDSCKFYIAAGSNVPPIPGVIDGNYFPLFFEAGYYFDPKTSLSLSVAPEINTVHYDFYVPPQKNTDFYLDVSLERHPKVFKWLHVLYGGGVITEFGHFSESVYSSTSLSAGFNLSLGFDIKLYKNLSFYDRSDMGYGWFFSTNSSESGYSGYIADRFLSAGLKFRF